MLKAHRCTLQMPACVTICATARGARGQRLQFAIRADAEPSRYHWLVPGQLLFVKLPACVVLIDPDSQAVAEIVTAPASTTGSAPAPTGSQAR
jgi:hypothetical protein